MKKLLSALVLIFFCVTAFSQAETTTVSYLKTDRAAVANEIPFPEKTIMGAIDEYMGKLGYKGKDTKGFTVYRSVKMPELGSAEYDLYFMAERKSRRNRDNSTLTLMISKGNDNFLKIDTDAPTLTRAMKYIEGLLPMITAHDLELQIAEQEDAIKKSDKKYNSLVDEAQSLEKKKKNIESDIEDNKKNQEKQLADIEKQKQILETLKASRKQ